MACPSPLSSSILSSSCLLLALFLFLMGVEGSHPFLPSFQSVEAPIVSPLYRTGYHFQPPKHWINDPNGPMYYNGIYHLFYQYNPYGAVWGNIVWAHSVSTDLINWKALDPAIYPSKSFDSDGCWSGSATILPGDKPVILYTGINGDKHQLQNMAVPKNLSDPYLAEWDKPDVNPLMFATKSNGLNASAFRDPTTGWQGPDGHWRVLVGHKKRTRGMVVLYRSKNFVHWIKAKHPLHSVKDTGMWECPDFYPVSKDGSTVGLETSVHGKHVKHVLKVSLDDRRFEYYTVGKYLAEVDRYVPDNTSADNSAGLRYDYGKFYASKTFFDSDKKRRVLWGWVNESDTVADDNGKGWSGLQCIPRTVWLDKNGIQLRQWPIREIKKLRQESASILNEKLRGGRVVRVGDGVISAAQADVEVTFHLPKLHKAELFDPRWTNPQDLCSRMGANAEGSIGPFGLLVLASDNLDEQTAVFFRIFRTKHMKPVVLMCSDQSRSSLKSQVDKTTYGGFVNVDLKHGNLSLRSLIDHSIVESFGGGGRTCITARVYPTMAVADQARLFAFNNGSHPVKLSKLQAWSMGKPLMN